MADLDDFFAKKDKKKSKKPKFLTAEELVKNLEETKRELVKAKKPEPTIQPVDAPTPSAEPEEIPKEPVSLLWLFMYCLLVEMKTERKKDTLAIINKN